MHRIEKYYRSSPTRVMLKVRTYRDRLLNPLCPGSRMLNASQMGHQVGILGVKTDVHGSFMKGPAEAPPLIREAMASKSLNSYTELGTNDLNAYCDFGDVCERDFSSTEAMHAGIHTAMLSILNAGLTPIVLGGDHHISNPLVKAVSHFYNKPVSIVQFDAHNDLYLDYEGDPYSHASPFARIMEAGPNVCCKLVQLGIRTATNHNRDQAKKYNVSMIEMKNMPADGKEVAKFLDYLLPPKVPVYISFDLDALDPAFAPAVSHWEPGGMTVRCAIDTIHHLRRNIVGADVVEYNPLREIHGMTAMVAAKLVREITAKIMVQNNSTGESH